jgi:hypothetical protein
MPASRRSADRARLRDRPAIDPQQRLLRAAEPGTAPAIRWLRLDPNDLPAASGIYAIRSGARWLYIGRSQCIAQRLQAPWHPARITFDLASLAITYLWHPHPPEGLARLERALNRQHAPEWNGGTSFVGGGPEAGPFCSLPHRLTPEEQSSAEAARSLLLKG